MSDQGKEVRLEGIVRADRYNPGGRGKPFLGAAIVCADGTVWVIHYSEESPFHAFAGRQVVVSGEPYIPEAWSQHLIGWGEGMKLGHFSVSSMRLLKVTPDAEFVAVEPQRRLRGRFERSTSETGELILGFVTEDGEPFLAANDPVGAKVGPSFEVLAYPVQPSPTIRRAPGRYLWILCSGTSEADLCEWRQRHSP